MPLGQDTSSSEFSSGVKSNPCNQHRGGWESIWVLCQMAFVDVRVSFSENSPLFRTVLQAELALHPLPVLLSVGLSSLSHMCSIAFLTSAWVTLM